jgi:hypothetical protein
MPDPDARAYLNAKFDQLTQAVTARDWDTATGVVAQMRRDGYAEAADDVFDGLVEVRNLADAADDLRGGPVGEPTP